MIDCPLGSTVNVDPALDLAGGCGDGDCWWVNSVPQDSLVVDVEDQVVGVLSSGEQPVEPNPACVSKEGLLEDHPVDRGGVDSVGDDTDVEDMEPV